MGIEDVCVYCGIFADTVDHVVPRHLLVRAGELELDLSRVMRMRQWTHPACHECNSSLSGRLFATLVERRQAAQKGIRRKYASYLRTPDWTDGELSEMGPKAQAEIVAAIAIRDWVRARLRWRGATIVEDVAPVFHLSQEIARKVGGR